MYAHDLLLRLLGAVGIASAVKLQVSTTGGNASSPLLYGLMFEVWRANPDVASCAESNFRISIILVGHGIILLIAKSHETR